MMHPFSTIDHSMLSVSEFVDLLRGSSFMSVQCRARNTNYAPDSNPTASATTQFCVCGDFLRAAENAANGRICYPCSCLHRDRRGLAGDFGRSVSGPPNSVSWENGDRSARDRFECGD